MMLMSNKQKSKQTAIVLVLTLLIISIMTVLTTLMLERTMLSIKIATTQVQK